MQNKANFIAIQTTIIAQTLPFATVIKGLFYDYMPPKYTITNSLVTEGSKVGGCIAAHKLCCRFSGVGMTVASHQIWVARACCTQGLATDL